MAEADPKMITEPAAHGVAEEVMASSASDSGEESDSSSSSSTSSCRSSSSSSSSGSSSSSSSGSSSSSSSSSGSQVYRKKRVPEPSRRAQRHPYGKHFMDKLPQAVRNRVQALRNIQDECDKVDTLFLRAIHDLERKYAELNKPLYDKRFQIINAEYEPTEEECEWNSEEEFSGDEEMQDDTPNEMPPLEGEEEESCKEKTEVKEEEKDVPKEVPETKVEENKAPKEIPEVKTEEKEIPKEVPEEKVQEKEATEEILEVKAEEKEASEEIPEVKFEEKETSEEIPEVKFEEKADSADYIEITPDEKEEPKEVPQANAENKDQPTEESKARAPVREAQKRVPETRPEEGGNVKRARKGKPKREDPKGIPDYWLTVLKNVDKLGPMIQKYDEPILKFLSDVSLKFSNPGQPISYTFEFHFLPNPYFRNEFLVKTYIIRSKPDHYDPFFAWGWEIEECKGCKIDWRQGKDVTVTTTRSRPAATGETEVQPRVVPNASFFNFFSPPEIPLIGKLEPREDAILDEDFEIGQILHDNVILKSIYYFTGEINDPYYHDVRVYGNRKYYK